MTSHWKLHQSRPYLTYFPDVNVVYRIQLLDDLYTRFHNYPAFTASKVGTIIHQRQFYRTLALTKEILTILNQIL